jgi:hypothetical protein
MQETTPSTIGQVPRSVQEMQQVDVQSWVSPSAVHMESMHESEGMQLNMA